MCLNKYQRLRKPENLATMAAMEGFKTAVCGGQCGGEVVAQYGAWQGESD